MKLQKGLEVIIPFTPKQHLNKTGRRCRIAEIHNVHVYVHRYNEKKKDFNKTIFPVDKLFLEKIVNNSWH